MPLILRLLPVLLHLLLRIRNQFDVFLVYALVGTGHQSAFRNERGTEGTASRFRLVLVRISGR